MSLRPTAPPQKLAETTDAAGARLWRTRVAILSIMAPVSAVGAMSYPLIALLMERSGVSEFWIGINAACAALAMICASWLGPRALSVARLNLYLAVAVLSVVIGLALFPFTEDYVYWTLLRIAIGAGSGAAYLAAEYWLITVAPAERRGREVGYYALSIASGMAVGPLLLTVTGVEGVGPFLAAAAVAALGGAGLALAWRLAPSPSGARNARGAAPFFWSDPSLIWAVALFGAVEFGAFGLAPVWILRLGLTEADAVAAVAALALGAFAFQPLIGFAIDRLPPRPLLIAAAFSCLVAPLAAAAAGDALGVLLAILFVWGGVSVGLYTVSLATLGGRYSGPDLAAANAAVVAAYGLGALIGPFAIGAAMSAAGANGLPAVIVAAAAAYLCLAFYRMRRRQA